MSCKHTAVSAGFERYLLSLYLLFASPLSPCSLINMDAPSSPENYAPEEIDNTLFQDEEVEFEEDPEEDLAPAAAVRVNNNQFGRNGKHPKRKCTNLAVHLDC